MNNEYMNFWQNAITDMFDTDTQLKKMDKIIEQSLTSFEEFASMLQQLGPWNSLIKPITPSLFDFRSSFDEYLKTMGFISIEEYRSLVKKYEELKKENQSIEKKQDEYKKKIAELNQATANEKKKLSTREKALETNKNKHDEIVRLADSLKKDLADEKKQTLALQNELNNQKKLVETMKKEIGEKETKNKKTETSKA